MKKELALISLFSLVLFLSFSFATALDFQMSKNSYYPGETMQVEFPNVFIDNLKTNNVLIYAKDAVHASPAESGVLKYNNRYHFYARVPTTPGDYELVIEGVKYWDGSVQSEEPIKQEFTIVSTNESYISFNPGYVYTSSSFSIAVKAYNADQEVNIELPEIDFQKTTTMGYGDSKLIYFKVPELNEKIESNIKIGSYSIPVIILASPSAPVPTTPTTPTEGDQSLEDLVVSDTDMINGSVLSGVDYTYQIVIVNKKETVNDIKLTSSDSEIKVSPEFISSLYKEQIINITVNTKSDFDGFVKFSTDSSAMTIPIHLKITEDKEEQGTNIPTTTEDKTCAKLGGIICAGEQKCTGSRRASIDSRSGNCCLNGDCKVPSNSSYWVIGVLLLILLGIGAWYIYDKASKSEGPDALNKIFAKKTQQYQKRMNPAQQQSNPEVRRSLGRL
ncbi:MAG: hypothetical protein Q8L27_04315 [archaeon]|nr:hypothetical protein [archaeon]